MVAGARLLTVDGRTSDCCRLAKEIAERMGWVNLTTTYHNPYGVDAYATIAYEIAHIAPDVLLLPISSGPLLGGIMKGFSTLKSPGMGQLVLRHEARRHPHRRARSASQCGVSRGPRASRVPVSSGALLRRAWARRLLLVFALAGDEPRPPFAFAGLWGRFRGRYRDALVEIETFTIVTTTPNNLVRPIHPDRMPVILGPDHHETWLSGTTHEARELLRPYPSDRMRIVRSGQDEKSDG